MQAQATLKAQVISHLDNLSGEQIQSVLDYVQFIESKTNKTEKTFTFQDLDPIIGILSIGGDAVEDSEIY